MYKTSNVVIIAAVALANCTTTPDVGVEFAPEGTGTPDSGAGTDDGGDGNGDDGTDDGGSGGSSDDDEEPKFDVDPGDVGDGDQDECKVGDDEMDAARPCVDVAPPDSFDPVVQWAWEGENNETQVVVTPLVANLTDDNDDGEIDLCDIPDVIVTAYAGDSLDVGEGHIYVLDGETGAVHYKIPQLVANRATSAIGDIDADGLPEIISVELEFVDVHPYTLGRLVAFNHDGTLLWKGDSQFQTWCSPALADMDNDGDVEILCKHLVDHEGKTLWEYPSYATVMVDLDGDGDLEFVGSGDSYHHDGTLYFQSDFASAGDITVANLDDDDDPEILGQFYSTYGGTVILEHDGTTKLVNEDLIRSIRPSAIHDVDGDDKADLLLADRGAYRVVTTDLTLVWEQSVSEVSGSAGSTAFDFLGDGSAEAIYADEYTLFVWDGADGTEEMTSPRSSWTHREYPVVADVDDDGSAEIVVVSNKRTSAEPQTSPAVQVLRDAEDRWIPARRIWNQHTYHVTNVREDGTIPQFEPPHWQRLNTFRTQAQISSDGGGICDPVPEG